MNTSVEMKNEGGTSGVKESSTKSVETHKSIKTHKFPRPDNCVICTESMADVTDPMICGHWFHLACVKKQFKAECAICRATLPVQVTGTRPGCNIEPAYQQGFRDGIHYGLSLLAQAGDALGVGPVIERYPIDDDDSDSSQDFLDEMPRRDPDEHTSQCDDEFCYCVEEDNDEPGSDEENPYGDDWCYEYV